MKNSTKYYLSIVIGIVLWTLYKVYCNWDNFTEQEQEQLVCLYLLPVASWAMLDFAFVCANSDTSWCGPVSILWWCHKKFEQLVNDDE